MDSDVLIILPPSTQQRSFIPLNNIMLFCMFKLFFKTKTCKSSNTVNEIKW